VGARPPRNDPNEQPQPATLNLQTNKPVTLNPSLISSPPRKIACQDALRKAGSQSALESALEAARFP